MDAIERRDREGWLALFSELALVEDPVGPSTLDPTGQGHRGHQAIANFYDTVIAPNESVSFEVRQSFECGDEVANVGTITIVLPGGLRASVEGVYCYRIGADGLIVSLRAFWEQDAVRIEDVRA